MELVKKLIRAKRCGKVVTDQFYVEDDYNVPDDKDDVSRIVLSEGDIKIEEMKRAESYLRVTGKLMFTILYVTDEGEARLSAIESSLPFEEMVYIDGGVEKEYVLHHQRVEFHAAMIHSRKLSVKALVELEIGEEEELEEEVTVDVDCVNPIYKKMQTAEVLKLHTGKKDIYRIKEQINIPGTKENIQSILWSDVTSRKLDSRLESDSLLLRGELLVFCFYESQDGKIDWVEQVVPYEGRVECYGAEETMYHHLYPALTDVAIDVRMDEDGEMRALGVEGTLELRMAVYEEEAMDILSDAYSVEQQCHLETKSMDFEEMIFQNHSKCKVVEQLSLPELKDDILQICHSSGKVQVEHMEQTEEGFQIEGVLHLSFLYVKENDAVPFDTWQGMVPFSYVIESKGKGEELKYDISHSLEQLSVSLLGSGEVEVKAVIAFYSFFRRNKNLDVITGMTFEPFDAEETAKRPGMIGYSVREGDTLWDLAKRYHTTVDGIMEVNDLASENIKQGEKILILKEDKASQPLEF